jgi:hypothetical protein
MGEVVRSDNRIPSASFRRNRSLSAAHSHDNLAHAHQADYPVAHAGLSSSPTVRQPSGRYVGRYTESDGGKPYKVVALSGIETRRPFSLSLKQAILVRDGKAEMPNSAPAITDEIVPSRIRHRTGLGPWQCRLFFFPADLQEPVPAKDPGSEVYDSTFLAPCRRQFSDRPAWLWVGRGGKSSLTNLGISVAVDAASHRIAGWRYSWTDPGGITESIKMRVTSYDTASSSKSTITASTTCSPECTSLRPTVGRGSPR